MAAARIWPAAQSFPAPPRSLKIRFSKLTLSNFRNITHATLDLEPGLNVFQGENGHGKSNLLESVYLLSVAKSPRASADRELVNWEVLRHGGHGQIVGVAKEFEQTTKAQIDFDALLDPVLSQDPAKREDLRANVRKSLRINGVQRTAAEFVGTVNVVAFAAEDIDLVAGSPGVRRRYLDILISQSDPGYLRTLQRYGRVTTQRNHLLRLIRERRAGIDELQFWDDRLCEEGASIVGRRLRAVEKLRDQAVEMHRVLAGERDSLHLRYAPNLGDRGVTEPLDAPQIRDHLVASLAAVRPREIAQGASVVGPHRDELEITLNGHPAGAYASRGQARTVALALKLAEAAFVSAATSRNPVLALDDVLSELDAARRQLVLKAAEAYEQVLMTTTDFEQVQQATHAAWTAWTVRKGSIEPGCGE